MTIPLRSPLPDETVIAREARRILRRLAETGAVLALARDMDKAAVLRSGPDGGQIRTAIVDRAVAQAFIVKDWIECERQGRVARYVITSAGRAALKRFLEQDRSSRIDKARNTESRSAFAGQHAEWGAREISDSEGKRQRHRVNLAESPLGTLARRKGPDGEPFLPAELLEAGERLREEFERAQMGPRVGQNWDRFLTAGDRGTFSAGNGMLDGPVAARRRVADALNALGPGLADVVMRVCCFLEGLETAERRLGWSARSGKVVLKIGLQRLAEHYRTDQRRAENG